MITPFTNKLKHLYLLIALFCAGITASQAQITWTTGYTADSLAGYLAGPGVEVDNAVIVVCPCSGE